MKNLFLLAIALILIMPSCKDDDDTGGEMPIEQGVDLTGIEYNPTAYEVVDPPGYPAMSIPPDNPMTEEGIELGRMLFFDPILSVDSTISCSSCHEMEFSFTDPKTLSIGVDGLTGRRNAMPLINIGYEINGLFWDGRVETLEEQALHPVEDPVEMADVWDNVEEKLRRHPDYPEKFRKAFGIANSLEITRDHAAKAIAQFERTMVSGNSRFDIWRYQGGQSDPFFFSEKESEGFVLFFDTVGGIAFGETAHCSHCHDGPLLNANRYENNGLTEVETLNDFPDKGRGEVTGSILDNGKFRAVSLRNIALTAPYMHAGQFNTLREVVEHYNSGVHFAENITLGSVIPPEQGGLGLDDDKIDAIVAFLHTFTDTTYYSNPAFRNPFE